MPFHQQAFSSQQIEDAAERRESEGVLSRFFGTVGGSYAGLEGASVAIVAAAGIRAQAASAVSAS